MNGLRVFVLFGSLAAALSCRIALVAAEPAGLVEGDRDLLAILSAAQATNSAAFPAGTLSATVHSESATVNLGNGGLLVDAKATIVWDRTSTYWTFEQVVARRGREPEVSAGHMIETPQALICYWPDRKFAQIIHDRSKQYLDELKLRPDRAWFHLRNGSRSWSEMFDVGKDGRKPTVPFDRFEVRADGPLIVVTRENEGGIFKITSSLDYGGNVTRYVVVNPSSTTPWYDGTYEWSELPDKRWRLERHKCAYSSQGDRWNPSRKYEMTVTAFEPAASIDPARFDIGSLNIPDGTTIDEIPPSSAGAYRKGRRSPTAQGTLDELADEMRKTGFAARER